MTLAKNKHPRKNPPMKPYQRKQGGNYYVEFQERGRRYRYNTKQTDLREARRVAQKFRKSVIDGNLGMIAQMQWKGRTVTLRKLKEIYEGSGVVSKTTATRNIQALQWLSGMLLDDPISSFSLKKANEQRNSAIVGKDPIERRSKMTSFNSQVRKARSIFARKHRHIWGDVILPDMSILNEIQLFKADRSTYKRLDDAVVSEVMAGIRELKEQDKQLFLIMVLARWAGFRAGEIYHAKWGWLSSRGLMIQRSKGWEPKSGHERMVPLVPAVVAEIESVKPEGAKDEDWMISGSRRHSIIYRDACNWLREKGVDTRKPVHELRKLFGCDAVEQFGIYPASKLLGHSDPSVTARYYADLVTVPNGISVSF